MKIKESCSNKGGYGLQMTIRVGGGSLPERLSGDQPPWTWLLLPKPRWSTACPSPPAQPPWIGVGTGLITILSGGLLSFSPSGPSFQFNLLISVLISLCRLFADFTRHNFYQLALKRGITNWGLLPLLERGPSPCRGHPTAVSAH